MRFPKDTDEVMSQIEQPTIYSPNGAQWSLHRSSGDTMEWEADCPALGYSVSILNRVQIVLLTHKDNGISGRYFYIPKLDSPLFYSLRAAARWANKFEFEVLEEAA